MRFSRRVCFLLILTGLGLPVCSLAQPVPHRVDHAPAEAVRDATAVYTDVWASMGQESQQELRRRDFAPYQVNAALMAHAQKGAFFMHCLPAHRGEEVTDEIMDGPQSVVFDEAENRLHAQKGVLSWCFGL